MTRGSMQYWQKRRAYRRLPRVRSYPKGAKDPSISNIVGYKVGMSHFSSIDESAKGPETSRACTIVEVPNTEMYGIRLYSKDPISGYKAATADICDRVAAQKAGLKKVVADETKIEQYRQRLGEFAEVTALLSAYPKGLSTGQHHADRFESHILGSSVAEKFELAAKLLGKEIRPGDVFKNGEHVDVISVSKGKGWQGVIKRFGVARLYHKATQKTRHVGTLGPFGMKRVLYSVPQSGQTGFNYRTEHNKKIVKIGRKDEAAQINPKSGFLNYGNITNDYIIIDGSLPGPSKRLVRIRKSITNRDAKSGMKGVKVTYIATTGKGV